MRRADFRLRWAAIRLHTFVFVFAAEGLTARDAVADVWVSGPPDSRPDRLILEAIDTSTYTARS
jgi:hypothetical protein